MKVFLLFSFISITSVAYGFEKPPYCSKYYDSIYSIENNLTLDEKIFTPRDKSVSPQFELSVADLRQPLNSYYAKDLHLMSSKNGLMRTTLTESLRLLLTAAQSYAGIYNVGRRSVLGSSLRSCIKKNKANSVEVFFDRDLENQKALNADKKLSFTMLNLNASLLLNAVLNYFSEYEEEMEEVDLKETRCRIINSLRPSRQVVISEECSKYVSEKDALNKKFEEETKSHTEIIGKLAQQHQLLVELKNDFEIFNWNNSRIVLSGYAQKLISFVPSNIKNELQESVKGKKTLEEIMKGFEEIKTKNLATMDSAYQKAVTSSAVKSAFRERYLEYIQGVNQVALFHCNNFGKYLHYHPQIVESIGNRMNEGFFTFKSVEENKQRLIALQALQCQRWRDYPYVESDRWTTEKIVGLGLLAIGGVISFIPGVGPVITGGFLIPGTLLLYEQNMEDKEIARINLLNEKFAYFNSWKDLRGVIQEADRIADINIEMATEIVLSFGAAAIKGQRLAEAIFQRARYVENMRARSAPTAIGRIQNMEKLIDKRYAENPPNLKSMQNAVASFIRGINGNTKVPALLRKISKDGDDHLSMLLKIANNSGTVKSRDVAFDDLAEVAAQYMHHRRRLTKLQIKGENARVNSETLEKYLTKINRSFFQKNKSGEYPDLPNFADPSLKVSRNKYGGLKLDFTEVRLNNNKLEEVRETYSFSDWDSLRTQRKDWREIFDKAFTHNSYEEVRGLSDMSAEINAQPYRYLVLNTARRMLINNGGPERVVDGVTVLRDLSDRQNRALIWINELLEIEDFFPRGDAYDRLIANMNRAEYRDLLFGALARRASQSKYAKDLEMSQGWGLVTRSLGLRLVFLGGSGYLSTLAFEQTIERNRWSYFAYQKFVATLRDYRREWNHKKDIQRAPHPYTNEEKQCAMTSRSWTLENDCIYKELIKELWQELYQAREKEIVIALDSKLKRKIRDYLRRYFANREFFRNGEMFQEIFTATKEVAQEYSAQSGVKYIDANLDELRGAALETALTLSDALKIPQDDEMIQGMIDKFKESDNPEEIIQAFEELLGLVRTGFLNATQAPGVPQELKVFVDLLIESARRNAQPSE